MYPRFAFALIFSVCAFGLGIAAPAFPVETQCGHNAEFQKCGSACVPDCANPEPPKMCTLQCVIGCFCKEGFLKNAMGECVRPEECQAKPHHEIPMQIPSAAEMRCPETEEFHPCGTACPATCANPNPSPVCTKNCVIGCFCKAGLLRNTRGTCVLTRQCEVEQPMEAMLLPPTMCGQNEEYRKCKGCDGTCKNPNPKCPRNCVPGCACKQDHLRNEGGVCIATRECDAVPMQSMLFAYPPELSQCKENEFFMTCGTACPATCANPRPGPVCTRQCIIGCFCKAGFLKNEQGVCVVSETCGVPAAEAVPVQAPVCGQNEEYRQCKGCDGTCKNPNPLCPRICIPGCACKKDHLRNDNGACTPTRSCPKNEVPAPAAFRTLPPIPECGANEVFRTCGTACPATCANPHPSPVCTKNCVIGCFCKEGFLKRDNGVCVAAANC